MFAVSRNTADDLTTCLKNRGHPHQPTRRAPCRQPRPQKPTPQHSAPANPLHPHGRHHRGPQKPRGIRPSLAPPPRHHAPRHRPNPRPRRQNRLAHHRPPATTYQRQLAQRQNPPRRQPQRNHHRQPLPTLPLHPLPSLYEGWGLPITESLCFGKTAATSNNSAIPEACQSFCTYFDPDNLTQTTQTIQSLIENPSQITRLEHHIQTHFHPPTWHQTATTLLNSLVKMKQPQPALECEVVGQ